MPDNLVVQWDSVQVECLYFPVAGLLSHLSHWFLDCVYPDLTGNSRYVQMFTWSPSPASASGSACTPSLLFMVGFYLWWCVCVFVSSGGTPYNPELEGTHKDHGVQQLAPCSTTQSQTCLKAVSRRSWNPSTGAVPTALCIPFHAHHPLVQPLSLTPSCPSPDTAPCRSLGPCHCHTEQSSALPSTPCEELQPPRGLSSAPLLCAEHTQGPSAAPHPSCHLCCSTTL